MLDLEIIELRARIKNAEQLIVRATPEEIKSYGRKISEPDVMFARASSALNQGDRSESFLFTRLWESLMPALLAGLALSFFGYLLNDIYRIARWLLVP